MPQKNTIRPRKSSQNTRRDYAHERELERLSQQELADAGVGQLSDDMLEMMRGRAEHGGGSGRFNSVEPVLSHTQEVLISCRIREITRQIRELNARRMLEWSPGFDNRQQEQEYASS